MGLFKKFFSSSQEKEAKDTDTSSPEAEKKEQIGAGEPDPVGFVKYTVEQLVSKPEHVSVAEQEGKDSEELLVCITCHKEDMGRVIGKKGRTIAALRSLARDTAGRVGKRIRIELME